MALRRPRQLAVPGAATAERRRPRDGWLSPFTLSEETAASAVPPWRASNTGCLPMEFPEYLELLDWTGRQLRAGKRGSIPDDLPPILERLHVTGAAWLDLMTRFSRLFRRAAGRPDSLRRHAVKWGRERSPGLLQSQALFSG